MRETIFYKKQLHNLSNDKELLGYALDLYKDLINNPYNNEWRKLISKYKSGDNKDSVSQIFADNYIYADEHKIKSDDDFDINKYSISYKAADYKTRNIPVKRFDIILIGLICDFPLDVINKCLNRFLKQSSLYSRDVDDFVWLYIINHRNEFEENQYLSVFYKSRSVLKRKLDSLDVMERKKTHKGTLFMNDIVRSNKAYIDIIESDEIIDEFNESRDKMIEYFKEVFDEDENEKYNLKLFDFHNIGSGPYKKMLDARNLIMKKRLPPKRQEIIAMFLHLKQDRVRIDNFFKSCDMENLLPKNIVESIVIYVLDYLSEELPNSLYGINNKLGFIDLSKEDIDIINNSWCQKYILLSEGNEYNLEDINLPISIIRGIILNLKESLDAPDEKQDYKEIYKYLHDFYVLL